MDHAYGDVNVLQSVSLTLPSGTVTALVGPNGSGKTTLLRVIAGLLDQTGGTIRHRNHDVVRSIGYLPQQPAFRPGFTARETLSFYAALVGADEDAATKHLERVGLKEAADRPVEELSGGMIRLLGIAQATIGNPPVVVLDEPGSGLDPGMRVHVFDVVGELAANGAAVLLSSHDLELVERSADRVAVLDRGRIASEGAPTEIRDCVDADTLLQAYEATVTGETGTVRVRGDSS
ncbi:ABC transporter ATP-binding protein [Halobacteria archaeon AArc-m2/3/4]|uniref:ABC transporter ATP-binding protein n=1 Tax=Natronoglomus mannanivorans TaxID=2979990 RepID=A0AAP3E3H6_9EURY|nr:ABC transporter ATP-binding protein [Halobacteria archaeon AArc-xg1-1]MCU4975815.1 ABC transporter ATP-binding protein [Halobacteria archaeon AArc-m2/3/4]